MDSWILYTSVCYLRGRGVTFGDPILQPLAANEKIFSVDVDVTRTPTSAVVDKDLDIFADNSLDHVFIGHRLANLQKPSELISQSSRKLKVGGHLVISTDVGNHSPGVMEFYPSILRMMVGESGRYRLKLEEERDKKCLLIFKKLDGKRGIVVEERKSTKPRACVCRYGALGDAIIMTPLVRQLFEDGYEVTLNITTYCTTIFENSPYVSNIVIQEKDAIPNHELGKYWEFWKPKYDKYINLSESLEGDLLQVEGRRSYFTHQAFRHKNCNKNYYDYTLMKGGYPEVVGKRGELFFTNAEERRAKEFFEPLKNNFKILWALNGSSHHKVYPLMEPVLHEWFGTHTDTKVITVGDYAAKLMEFPHPQMIPKSGEWKIRESLIATKYVDLVIGPETMITNASGCFQTPKITFLSHSSHENLCKYWENDYCLEPNLEFAPCYPCHQLHYTKEGCPQNIMMDNSTGMKIAEGPRCAMGAIEGPRLLKRIDEVYQKWQMKN
jgi:ADP-heptose:LPS heptosyltransferase